MIYFYILSKRQNLKSLQLELHTSKFKTVNAVTKLVIAILKYHLRTCLWCPNEAATGVKTYGKKSQHFVSILTEIVMANKCVFGDHFR